MKLSYRHQKDQPICPE